MALLLAVLKTFSALLIETSFFQIVLVVLLFLSPIAQDKGTTYNATDYAEYDKGPKAAISRFFYALNARIAGF
ncbi:MAG: hypothetical protein AAB354_06200 [candidate division KSB1 bacterium]